MQKTWIILASCLCITGCFRTTTVIKGSVIDASMNTVTLQTQENKTYVFSTIETDKSQLNGLLLGKSVKAKFQLPYQRGQKLLSLSDYPQPADLFNEATVLIPADSVKPLLYLLADRNTLRLFDAAGNLHAVLSKSLTKDADLYWQAKALDLKLQKDKGLWKLKQKENLLYSQAAELADSSLGELIEERFVGVLPAADCSGIRYDLRVKHRTHSGDGLFLLTLTYLNAETDRDLTYSYLGRRFTLRGSADDNNAIVWQCQTDDQAFMVNFLYEPKKQSLSLLTKECREIHSQLNYTLKKVQ